MKAADIARELAAQIESLAADLLPNGRREGHEWRCGSRCRRARAFARHSSHGPKAGIWSDFAAGLAGDALDLVAAVLSVPMAEALDGSRQWLGVDEGAAAMPRGGGATESNRGRS